ncbi:glycosyltransferase [Tissierella creatinophila]|uniref:Glycogen synthase n=1 Tax=Tissierella creatinophila DSM 6911 TaxID=1123403 RepID=A0A1U7M5R5_TISCR|nr:glycosyltransferase [Tissierella creatinophila]OLS02626.1 glycogen synthase [Tissierella creatinophila DSM 6911]
MYILILSRGYPTKENKILGIFEMDQARALKRLGHKVVFLSTDIRSIRRKRKWGYERKTIDGIEIYGMNIPLGKVPPFIANKASSLAINYLYKKVIEEEGKPDILHAHFTHQGYLGSLLKEKYGIPLVVTEHSSHVNKDNIRAELVEKGNIAYKNADSLITVSPTLKKRIQDKFGVDSIYIPNIVDTSLFKYQPREKKKQFRFVSTGHLIPIKGTETTINAFYKAFNDNENVSLTIFGEGNERKKLETLIRDLGLENRIKLMGQTAREDMAKEYNSSDAFVLASRSETFGVSYIEALSSGLPVLATKCGGPEVFVNNENGMLSDVDDVDGLAKNMRFIYENVDKFNNQELSQRAREEFSSNSIGEKIVEVYRSIL